MKIRQNDSGRSIVEMLGVLAVMGVITVMGIQGYSQAISKINKNKTVESITRIAQEVRGLFASRQSYNSNDMSSEVYDIGGSLLEPMGVNITSPYGGKFVVKSVGAKGQNSGFYISVDNIPRSDCLYYQTMNWTDVMTNNISQIRNAAYFGDSTPGGADACTTNAVSTMTLYYK